MALTVSHSTAADGTFSAAGQIAWDANHSISGTSDIAVGTTAITSGTTGRLLYDNAGAVGEAIVGTGLSLAAGTLSVTASGISLAEVRKVASLRL